VSRQRSVCALAASTLFYFNAQADLCTEEHCAMVNFLRRPLASLSFAAALLSNTTINLDTAEAATLVQGVTNAANNDDFTGPFGGDFNSRGFLSLTGFNGDQVFAVQPSGGTTEYLIRLSSIFSTPTNAVHVELGFGVGNNFVSAANVLPALDFDAPVPGTPMPQSSVFTTVRHMPYVVEFSNGSPAGIVIGAAEFAIDVPDLPVSVNNYYAPGELPANLPDGAAAFTLRRRVGPAIPEPSSILLLLCCAAILIARRARFRNYSGAAAWLTAGLSTALLYSDLIPTANAATVTGAVTGAANNDDFGGSFGANPNRHSPGGGSIASLERVIPVADSGGTSEYAFTISGGYSTDDGPITRDYRLQLGFGTGDAFVPARQLAPELDFDMPQPASPAPQIAIFGPLKQHSADTLVLPGLPAPLPPFSSFFLNDMFKVSIDVPDLPNSVTSFYSAANLPPGIPVGTKAFTIRGGFVPEPSSLYTLGFSLLFLIGRFRAKAETSAHSDPHNLRLAYKRAA
jgi:hypothetical protein